MSKIKNAKPELGGDNTQEADLTGDVDLAEGDTAQQTGDFSTAPTFDQGRTIRGHEGSNTSNFASVNIPVANCKVIIAAWGATSTTGAGGTFQIKESSNVLASRSFPSTNSLRVQVADLYVVIDNPSVGNHTYSIFGQGQINTTRITNFGGKVIVIEPDDTHEASLIGSDTHDTQEEGVIQ